MYKCCSCKLTFNSEPAMVNAAGKFCTDCEEMRKARLRTSQIATREAKADKCLWCGVSFDKKFDSSGRMTHVCPRCDKGRSWLLRCIRNGIAVSQYVSVTEQRELPLRIERANRIEKERIASETVTAKDESAKQPAPVVNETRLDKIEKMLLKLTEALGGV